MAKHDFLPVVTPEEVGIPSATLLRFLDILEQRQIPMHSLLLVRDNKLAFESYWAPFHQQRKHRMYSISKSFAAIAIGVMADQGKISLSDKVVSFFPEKISGTPSPFLAEATIQDLLKMTSVHDGTTYKTPTGIDKEDWIATFFQTQPTHKGGTAFNYDTSASTILSAIVEKVSGMSFLEYLREPLLDPIGFSKDAWCVKEPGGYSWAGSGVLCTSRDLARMALVLLNEGKWNGEQLLSKEFVAEATANQVDNRIANTRENAGYGYQIWRLPQNGFAFFGMGSQLALCYPQHNFLLVQTADTQEYPEESNALVRLTEELLLPALSDTPLSASRDTQTLEQCAATLKLSPLKGEISSPLVEKISGKTYQMEENVLEFSTLRFEFRKDNGTLFYTTPRGEHEIDFGLAKNKFGTFPETHYYGDTIGTPSGKGYEYACSATWSHENSLLLYCYIIDDYLGLLKMDFTFEDDFLQLRSNKIAEFFLDEYVGYAHGTIKE